MFFMKELYVAVQTYEQTILFSKMMRERTRNYSRNFLLADFLQVQAMHAHIPVCFPFLKLFIIISKSNTINLLNFF